MRTGLDILGLCCLAIAVALAGCTSATDVSRVYPFNSYVGKTVQIDRPLAVVHTTGGWTGSDGVRTLRWFTHVGLTETNDLKYGYKSSGILPVGHIVHIDCVRDEVAFDSESIVAYGRTSIPPKTNLVSFVYAWGFLWTLHIAPWEPETLPQYRSIPSRFRLPPHFDYDMFRGPTNAPTWDAKP